jgi:antitoxin MazE
MLTTTVSRWGNSLGVRIPKDAAERAQIHEGDEVQIIADDGRLSIVASGVMTLDRLIDTITPENRHGEQFAKIVGTEAW